MTSDYKDIWIIAELRNSKILSTAFELLSIAKILANKRNCKLSAVVFGEVPNTELQNLIYYGADQVIYINNPELNLFLPQPYSNVLEFLINKYRPETILASATSTGRTLLPIISIKCHTGLTADCTQLDIDPETGNLLQIRPAIGGNILATIKTQDTRPQLATIRPKTFKIQNKNSSLKGQIITPQIDPKLLHSKIKHIGFKKREDSFCITDSDIVVAGGKGLKNSKNFALIQELANLLKGSVGASRDAVDRAWITYPHQVGLSGKTISPKLYLCIGISGTIQHIAGIKTAQKILAINKDPKAPIFKLADFGIVADLFLVIPKLIQKIKQTKIS